MIKRLVFFLFSLKAETNPLYAKGKLRDIWSLRDTRHTNGLWFLTHFRLLRYFYSLLSTIFNRRIFFLFSIVLSSLLYFALLCFALLCFQKGRGSFLIFSLLPTSFFGGRRKDTKKGCAEELITFLSLRGKTIKS